jgi:hypothetical protein
MEHEYGAFKNNKKMKELIDTFVTAGQDLGVIEEGGYPLLFINQPGRMLAFDLSDTEVLLGTDKLTDILDKILLGDLLDE